MNEKFVTYFGAMRHAKYVFKILFATSVVNSSLNEERAFCPHQPKKALFTTLWWMKIENLTLVGGLGLWLD